MLAILHTVRTASSGVLRAMTINSGRCIRLKSLEELFTIINMILSCQAKARITLRSSM